MSGHIEHHVQCRLTKVIPDQGTVVVVSWIPEEYAQIGRVVDLKDNDVWDKGFVVSNCYTKMQSKYVMERSRDYRETRKASDV